VCSFSDTCLCLADWPFMGHTQRTVVLDILRCALSAILRSDWMIQSMVDTLLRLVIICGNDYCGKVLALFLLMSFVRLFECA